MFVAFFYLLRTRGLHVSLGEWMSLMEALAKGLHGSSLTGFYHLCRTVLVKSEADFDRFDQVFLEFFKDVPFPEEELPRELLDWLANPRAAAEEFVAFLRSQGYDDITVEDILKMFEERLAEQTEEHNGGSYWIGTGGYSTFGHSGHAPKGIRVGGVSRHCLAFQVAGERRFRDFRRDNVLDIRQFQMAFRLLREYSARMSDAPLEFDVDETIRATCDNAGRLEIRKKRPRRNTVKVLMLIDSGGSMEYYARLCSMLFQAATSANHFKELHVYYFHNCVYSRVFTEPTMYYSQAVETEWLLKNFSSEYKVIFVGDALMDMYELRGPQYDWRTRTQMPSGLDWLERFAAQYSHLVWLNPEPRPSGGYWGASYGVIEKVVDMFPLTVDGIEDAMKKLMVKR